LAKKNLGDENIAKYFEKQGYFPMSEKSEKTWSIK